MYFIFNIYLFIWLPWVLVAAHEIFYPHCGMRDLRMQGMGSSSLIRN